MLLIWLLSNPTPPQKTPIQVYKITLSYLFPLPYTFRIATLNLNATLKIQEVTKYMGIYHLETISIYTEMFQFIRQMLRNFTV